MIIFFGFQIKSIPLQKYQDEVADLFQEVLINLWLENISYEEIAAIMGITVKNVSVRLYRIKEELKNMSNK